MEAEHGVRWESDGTGSYTLETLDLPARGTEIVLHLREEERKSQAETEKGAEGLVERIKNALGERVEAVRVSHRLTSSPALLTVSHSSPGLPSSPILRIRIGRGM